MIERLYVDNFRCLVNCEIKLGRTTLLLGANGAGKSSVFDVASRLRHFVGNAGTASELFPAADLTAWQNLNGQRFELDLRSERGLYRYALKLEHAQDRRRCRVMHESLRLDDRPLLGFEGGDLQLYNDAHHPGPRFSFDWDRSGLATVYARPENQRLTEFKQRLRGITFVRPCPPMMDSDSQTESEELDPTAANFASWYRFVARQDISRQLDLFQELRQTLEGFDSIKLDGSADSTVTMRVVFKSPGGKPLSFKFGQLSDGQRQLIVLHALLYGVSDEHRTLFLDEPDNYVALREVQPFLTSLTDAAGRGVDQAVIISHHPEAIDYLAAENGVWLSRDGNGPVRVETGRAADTAPLRPSEVEARGW